MSVGAVSGVRVLFQECGSYFNSAGFVSGVGKLFQECGLY